MRIRTLCAPSRAGAAAGLRPVIVLGAVAAVLVPGAAVAATTGTNYRVSLSAGHGDPNLPSTRERISPDGGYVVFESNATNLVASPKDRNSASDVFWVNATNPGRSSTKVVSIGYDGSSANGRSSFCDVSANGRYVVFNSSATNIVPGWKHSGDIYIRDMTQPNLALATRVVSKTAAGGVPNGRSERPTVSDDGRYVAFNSTATNLVSGASHANDVYVKDTATGRVLRVSNTPAPGGDDSLRAEISGDGTHVAFASDVRLTSNDHNSTRDVYAADLRSWRSGGSSAGLTLVSVNRSGVAGNGQSSRPGINANGTVVTFQSFARDLVAGDTNGKMDAFWRSTASKSTRLVSTDPSGGWLNGESSRPIPNASGQFVTFVSTASRVVTGDTNSRPDVFLRNMNSVHTIRVSVSASGGNGYCGRPSSGSPDTGANRPYISASGNRIAFLSGMCNLVGGAAQGGPDRNGKADIYLRVLRSLP